MKKNKIIPAIILLSALIASVLYFEVFRFGKDNPNIISGSGTIEATEIEIGSKIAGRIGVITCDEGDDIKKNDLLIKLEYEELNAQRKSARANLINAQKNVIRMRNLYKSGAVSKQSLDNAETAYSLAKAAADQVSATIDNALIYSPITGTILNKNLEIGEIAFPGSSILTIADLKKLWIKVYISEKKLGHVKLGDRADISVDSFPEKKFEGKVIHISNKAEFTPKTIQTKEERVKLMFAVKVAVDNINQKLKSGMPADVTIYRGNSNDKTE